LNFLKTTLFFSVLFISSLVYHWSHLKTFPTQIHAWAQCDYISISQGFQENNYNLFLPQQSNFNKQFENRDSTANSTRITSADFPIVPYVNAIISAYSGKQVFRTYRILTLLLSCIGLTFLFLIAYHYSSNYVGSIATVLLFSITPIYLDYQDGFLPSTPALSFLFIGFYNLIIYSDKKSKASLIFAFVFFSCSALIRFPFVIFLIAIFLAEIWETRDLKSLIKNRIISSSIISILLVLLYFIYNSYLRNQYGSIFLASSVPARSFNEIFEIIYEVKSRWGLHYFTICQYFLILFLVIRGLSKLLLDQTYYSLTKVDKVITLSGIGVMCYLILMGNQLRHHDYYSLDTFYPILILTGVISLSKLKASVGIQFVKNSFLIVLALISLKQANTVVNERRALQLQDSNHIIFNSYLDADIYLSSLGISSSDKVLVFDAFAPNMPLLLMDRCGFSLRSCNGTNIKNALKWDYDYVVISNYYLFDKILSEFPEIKSQIKFIESNGKISVFCRNQYSDKHCDLLTFLKVANKSKTIDNSNYQNWNNFKCIKTDENIGMVESNQTYGPSFETALSKGSMLYFSGQLMELAEKKNVQIVIDVTDNFGVHFYKSISVNILYPESNKSNFFELVCYLPKLNPTSKLKLYFYNPEQDQFKYSDLHLIVY
jgi:hypothetical protein